tara:strand:+ start:532 stop:765 length:234 start_codon:yes stop_codon:yes gene_type:complete
MLGCLVLLYAVICIPVYINSLMHVFNAAILFNLVCMLLLAVLITYDFFQDHNPITAIIEITRDPDPDSDGLGGDEEE